MRPLLLRSRGIRIHRADHSGFSGDVVRKSAELRYTLEPLRRLSGVLVDLVEHRMRVHNLDVRWPMRIDRIGRIVNVLSALRRHGIVPTTGQTFASKTVG